MSPAVEIKLLGLKWVEFHMFIHRLIALKMFYQKSFEWDSIGVGVWLLIEFKSVKLINQNVSFSKCLTLIKLYTLKN